MTKLLDPKNDFIFKNIFGNENYPEILISFLNAVFGISKAKNKIKEVKIDNTFLEKRSIEDKYSILDIKATLGDGTKVNIEMQVNNPYHMEKRTLYYLSRIYSAQLKEKEKYNLLQKTVSINVLNFNLLNNIKYHNKFVFKEQETNEVFSDMMELHFLELKKLNKSKEELENELENWMEFLIEPTQEVVEMLEKRVPEIREAYKLLEVVSLDKNSKELYELREIALKEKASSLSGAEEKGRYEEREKNKKEKIEMVKNLLKNGVSVEIIAKSTNLSEEEIVELKKEI